MSTSENFVFVNLNFIGVIICIREKKSDELVYSVKIS